MKIIFHYKDPFTNNLKSFLVHRFTCASCCSSYIGETCCHFKTRIEEHIKKDNKSHIFKHLHSTAACFDSYNYFCFRIVDKTSSKFSLTIKEALHINWRKVNLNPQQNHLAITLSLYSLQSLFVCFFFSVCFFAFLFHLLFSLSLTLIIGIFYCLNYSLLLLHLITTHFVSHLSLSSVFIISMLIISIFHCLNYTLLLLHLFITHLVTDFIITM